MTFRCAVLCAVSVAFAYAADTGLAQIRTVYVLPMSGGLDQYLANKLTEAGSYQVVTEPEHADAVLTDRLGPDFEERLRELYPPPAPPVPSAGEAKLEEEKSLASLMGEAGRGTRTSSFSRGRGNIFLVDRHSRRVLWSTYLRPRNTRPDELNHVADGVVGRLDGATRKEAKRMMKSGKPSQQPDRAPSQDSPPAIPVPQAPQTSPAPTPQS